ncbi:unnamed protein product, partial [Meganyctiphanes norvegica]
GPVKDGLLLVVPGDGTYTECQLKDSNLGCHRITTISTNTQGDMSYQNKDMKHHIEKEAPLKHNDDSSTRNKSNIAGYSSLQDATRQLVMPLSAGVNSLPESQWWGGNITTHTWGVTFTLWHTFQHPGMYQVLVVFTEKSSLHPTWTKLKSVQVQDIFTIWTGHSHVLLLDNNTTGARASAFALLHPMACSKDDTHWQWDFHDDHHDGVNVQVTLLNDTSTLEEWQQMEFDEFEELQKEMIDTVQLNGKMMENLNTGVWSQHVYHRAGTYDLTVAADCQGEAIGSKTIRDAFMVVKPITGIYISVLGMDEELALKFSIRNNSTVCSTSPVVLSVTVEEGSHLQEMRLHFGDRNSTIVKHKNLTIASPLAWNVQ